MTSPLNRARALLLRAIARAELRPTLLDALLCARLPGYLFFRLRPFLVYRLLGLLAHLAELFVLIRLFPDRALIKSVVLNNVCALGSAFFWAALEPARQQAQRARTRAEAAVIATPYLVLTALFALCSAGWSLRSVASSHGGVASLYAAAVLLRLLLDMLIRALQIPIAVSTRVFRPPALMLLRPLIAPLVLISSWDLFGPRSLPLSIAAATLGQFALAAMFTLRTYRLQRVPLPQPRLRHLAWLRRGGALKTQLLAGLSGLLPASANLVVGALMVVGASRDSHRSMLVVLHAMLPLFQSASGWAQTTYVDLHWLLKPWRAALRRRYEAALERTAPLLALALLPWIAAVAALVTNRSTLAWTLASAPLLWAQAWIAALQLRLFVRGRFGLLSSVALAQLVGLLGATVIVSRLIPMRGAEIALLSAAVQLAAVFALRRILAASPERSSLEARPQADARDAQPAPLAVWTALLRQERRPLCVAVLSLRAANEGRLRALTARLETLAALPGAVASDGPTRLLVFSPAPAGLERSALLALGSGLIAQLQLLGPLPDGAQALLALRAQGALPDVLPESLESAETLPPGMLLVDLARGVCPPELLALPSLQRRALFVAAEGAARGARRPTERSLPYDAIADHPAGVLTRLLLVPRSAPPRLRAELRRRSLARALAPG